MKVRCECKKSRSLYEATHLEDIPLGICSGARPWLGPDAHEECNLPSRLLIRTAANAYFPQVVSVLSIPDKGSKVESIVKELWDDLQIVDDIAELADIFANLMNAPYLSVRLARVTTNACRRTAKNCSLVVAFPTPPETPMARSERRSRQWTGAGAAG